MTEVTHKHSVEVLHQRDETDSSRDVSVEVSQGQSGKFGFTVKAYGATAQEAASKVTDGVKLAEDIIEERGGV